MGQVWNAELYQASHSFVWEYGRELIGLLDPRPGERILDLGCGTGQLTVEIGRSGASVLGVDNATAMIEQAGKNWPEGRFELIDALALPFREEFDAVFSNAVLHWVREADTAIAAIARALKPGGRLVAEFGGKGNVGFLLEAAWQALGSLGVRKTGNPNPWYFPSVAEYAGLLESHGLETTFAALFDRFTPLEGGDQGLANWVAMFGQQFAGEVAQEKREEFLRLVEKNAAPRLLRGGVWHADYRRLRVVAFKPNQIMTLAPVDR
jgi:trans-aconitate methyltransferase